MTIPPLRIAFAVVASVLTAIPASALEPAEVFVLVNKNVPGSQEVADHYCMKRNVPAHNVIPLDLPKTEDIGRREYDERMVAPIREALKDKKDRAKLLLSTHGVPLRVAGSQPNAQERTALKELDAELAGLREEHKRVLSEIKHAEGGAKGKLPDETPARRRDLRSRADALQWKLRPLEDRRRFLSHAESQASVDSELMLLWWDRYELRRWQVNLLYFQVPESQREGKPPTLLTCRLDGPSPATAKRLVDLAIEAERKGLDGKVYVDARGIRFDPKGDSGHGYGGYDESMREMARLLERDGKMTVVLDDKNDLFAGGACGDCALYCGWYSHANFVDCCQFVPGAVAWHLASSEAVSLRRPDVKYWCKNLLERGAAATVGPVAEPYTIGFPKPAEFFGFLATGKYTLAECYARSVMLSSWMGVLIGDPLYNPFAKNSRLKEERVVPSPKGGRSFLPRPQASDKKP